MSGVRCLSRLRHRFKEATVHSRSHSRQNCVSETNRFSTAHAMKTTPGHGSAQLKAKMRAASAAGDIEIAERPSDSLQKFCHIGQFTGDAFENSFVDVRSARRRAQTRDDARGMRIEIGIARSQQVWSNAQTAGVGRCAGFQCRTKIIEG